MHGVILQAAMGLGLFLPFLMFGILFLAWLLVKNIKRLKVLSVQNPELRKGKLYVEIPVISIVLLYLIFLLVSMFFSKEVLIN